MRRLFMLNSPANRGARTRRWSTVTRANTLTLVAPVVVVTLCLIGGCGGNHARPSSPEGPVSETPSRENIIEAVRHSVEGKTYEVTTQSEPTRHTCEQFDVNVHRYGCSFVGQPYTTSETVPQHQTKHCGPLPGPDYGWQVTETGSDKWRVSQAGSVWDVEKLNGAAINGGEAVNVSSFSFSIHPHQNC